MGTASKYLDALDIAFDSRSAIHDYVDRVRELAHHFSVDLSAGANDLKQALLWTPPTEETFFHTRKWTAKKVSGNLLLASELVSDAGIAVMKIPSLFDQYYVGTTTGIKKKGIVIDM